MVEKIRVRNLYKIFGDDAEQALALVKEGRSKEEILAETGQTVGVRAVNFTVEQGEIFVVMGLSGSGKSTLVRMLNGLIRPTSGEILIDDADIVTMDPETLRQTRLDKVSMVFQHFALFPHKTVAENAAYGLKIRGMPRAEQRARAMKALEQVGLTTYADSYPDALSGGMQQRVGLARALAAGTDILLMDEPFSALDPLIRRDMQEELLELQRSLKKTIVFITHDLNEALILGHTIAIMKDGSIVQMGTAEEIVGDPANDYVAAFTQDVDRSRVFQVDSIARGPQVLQLRSDTARTAMEVMEKLERNALYVLDGEAIAGIVTYRDAARSARANGGDLGAILIRRYPTARRHMHLNQLYERASEGLPIAVIDSRKRLVGVVEPEAVFAQLAGTVEAPRTRTDETVHA